MDKIEPYLKKIDDAIAQYPSLTQYDKLKELETKTGQPKALFFIGIVVVLFGLVFAIGGLKLFADLVGFIYPAYMSFKALEGGKSVDGDATQWMTYWIVFCFLTLFESTFPSIVSYIKFYYIIKCAFVVWLFHPKFAGAEVVYSVIQPHIGPLINGSTSTVKPVDGDKESEAKKDE